MKTSKRFILSFLTVCLFVPTLTLRIRNNSEGGSRGYTASPTLIYRRRLNGGGGGRFKESIYPQTSPVSPLEQKTDSYPTIISQPNGFSGETVEPNPNFSSTTSSSSSGDGEVSIPKSLRRNRSRLRAVISSQESVEQEYATKPTKSKTGRRRKVKRPLKVKPALPPKISSEEELGGAESVKSNATGGDKNLALEIGSEDGKYALIDKFFEQKPQKAPGVISYAQSSDFSGDNQYTLGNVKQNDIWLSEGHLLVLKGGDLDASFKEHWKPIDNYQRGNKPPLRIALDSDNPPPFPVFINDTGPPIFLGPPPPFGPYPPPGGFNESFDPSRLPPPGLIPLYPNGTIPDFYGPPPPGAFAGGNNSLAFFPGPMGGGYGNGGQFGPNNNNGSFPPPFPPFPPGRFGNNTGFPPPNFFPFPPPGNNRNGSFPPPFYPPPPPGFNQSGGPPPGGYPFLPPLALNPNDNETDDPSIFLPPPYDFDYQDDNSTLVPPGPFAPGLVVPPPKNFYTVYNKTTRRPTFPPATGLSAYFGKRPQRPNGKKPKFPITNPPDDSEEAYQPLTTPTYTPTQPTYPYHSEVPFKKRKQRPGKANKGIFPAINKYDSESDTGKVSVIQPTLLPLPEQVISQRPLVNIPLIQNVISTTIGTTPKPLNNYVYVRGQLKSLAELDNNSQEDEYEYEPTPRPPFDERGYPSRVVDDNEPVIYQYSKKTTEVPAKSFYYNTPKYDAIYNNNVPKKSKKQQNRYYQSQSPDIPPSQQSPIVQQQETPSLYFNPNNNRLGNQGHNIFNPSNNFQGKITPNNNNPTFFTRPDGQPQQTPQIIQLQSPKSYPVTSQRQPHSYNNHHANVPQNLNYPTTSAFRPAFGPTNTNNQQQSDRSKILFPGQVTQSGPIFNFRTPLYQPQGRPQIDGYYSPVTQYYQPLQSNRAQQQDIHNNNNNNNYYQSPLGGSQQRFFGSQNSNPGQVYQPKNQVQPYYNEQGNNNQELPNAYKSQQINQFVPQSGEAPLRQDLYVNYREPLPQYNTESEAVTTRTIFKAGPSHPPSSLLSGAESSDGKPKTALADGSFYSFQRGGPGGFSYKIRL